MDPVTLYASPDWQVANPQHVYDDLMKHPFLFLLPSPLTSSDLQEVQRDTLAGTAAGVHACQLLVQGGQLSTLLFTQGVTPLSLRGQTEQGNQM